MKFRSRARPAGFTLIEVLVAIIIFAVLALISYRTLTSLFQTRERLQQESSALRDQALFFARLQSDLNSFLRRENRNADGQLEPALRLFANVANPNDARITFTRTGFAANIGTSAAPQRIGYRLKDNTIELLIWAGLEQAPRAEPKAYPALKNVREFSWRALEPRRDAPAEWRADWPTREHTDAYTLPPAALELTITPMNGAPIVRVFALRGADDPT